MIVILLKHLSLTSLPQLCYCPYEHCLRTRSLQCRHHTKHRSSKCRQTPPYKTHQLVQVSCCNTETIFSSRKIFHVITSLVSHTELYCGYSSEIKYASLVWILLWTIRTNYVLIGCLLCMVLGGRCVSREEGLGSMIQATTKQPFSFHLQLPVVARVDNSKGGVCT